MSIFLDFPLQNFEKTSPPLVIWKKSDFVSEYPPVKEGRVKTKFTLLHGCYQDRGVMIKCVILTH